MTDMTDTEAQARIEAIRLKRAGQAAPATASSAGTARRKPATGSKIAAAGFGTATMLGLIGAMALAQHPASAAPAPAVSIPPAQIVVVIHRDGVAPAAAATAPAAAAPSAVAAPAAVTKVAVQAPAAPRKLVATPTVRQAPAAAAPVAKSHGSK